MIIEIELFILILIAIKGYFLKKKQLIKEGKI